MSDVVRMGDERTRALYGRPKHGMYGTRVYRTWNMMTQRCHNSANTNFKHYGARGISVCERWRKSFADFYADVGDRPDGMSLDRFPDNNGNYEPGNVRWASHSTQMQNTRSTKLEAHEPEQIRWLASLGYSHSSIARFFEIDNTTANRIVRGINWKAA